MILILIHLAVLSNGNVIPQLPPIPISDWENVKPANGQHTEVPFSASFNEHVNFHDQNMPYNEKNHLQHNEEQFFTDNLFACFNNYYTQIYFIKTCTKATYKNHEKNIKIYFGIKDKSGKVHLIPGYLKQLNEWGSCLQTAQNYNSDFSPRIKRYRLNIIDYLVVIDSHVYVMNVKQIEKQVDNVLWNSWSFATLIMRLFNCYNEVEDSFIYNKWLYEMAELVSVLFALACICLFVFGFLKHNYKDYDVKSVEKNLEKNLKKINEYNKILNKKKSMCYKIANTVNSIYDDEAEETDQSEEIPDRIIEIIEKVNLLIIFYLINTIVTIMCKSIWAVINDHFTSKIQKFLKKRTEKVKKYKKRTSTIEMKNWLVSNLDYPYPDFKTKSQLAVATGLSIKQVCKWFTNERQKLKKIAN